jgi:hypothetical protein
LRIGEKRVHPAQEEKLIVKETAVRILAQRFRIQLRNVKIVGADPLAKGKRKVAILFPIWRVAHHNGGTPQSPRHGYAQGDPLSKRKSAAPSHVLAASDFLYPYCLPDLKSRTVLC